MRQTKIVATIGPASDKPEVLLQLVQAGVDVARLNFSHGNHSEHKERFSRIRTAAQAAGKFVPIILDTKGPELRLGCFRAGPVELTEGQLFTLYGRERWGDQNGVSISSDLASDIGIDDYILIDDGLVKLVVVGKEDSDIICRVVVGGVVADRKGINIPDRHLNLPVLSEEDRADIQLGAALGVDFIAQSFVRSAADVLALKSFLEELDSDTPIIAKIESQYGVENIEEILQVSDGLMVARGDLGVEIPTEEVPLVQKKLIALGNQMGKPVITATQMLESMTHSPRPTRAEASDVANAILDGTDAVMLSGETASGRYPLEAVATMARIAERIEQVLQPRPMSRHRAGQGPNVTDAISYATVQAATDLQAAAIITSTESGSTARMVSRYRPNTPIIAFTMAASVARRLNLSWGVHPVLGERVASTDEMIHASVARALDEGLIKTGDLVVLTAGVPVGVPGTTNLIKVHVAGDVLAHGVGIGKSAVVGPIVICQTAQEAMAKVNAGCILVTPGTDKDYVPTLRLVKGLVTEEGGLTSHAAVVALNLGIPVIVGVPKATELLTDGQLVTLDTEHGLIYRGRASIPS